jgi:hypothetical protein
MQVISEEPTKVTKATIGAAWRRPAPLDRGVGANPAH